VKDFSLLIYEGSSGYLEVAVNRGRAIELIDINEKVIIYL
jgi:S-adenosylmethionine hydrolase